MLTIRTNFHRDTNVTVGPKGGVLTRPRAESMRVPATNDVIMWDPSFDMMLWYSYGRLEVVIAVTIQ